MFGVLALLTRGVITVVITMSDRNTSKSGKGALARVAGDYRSPRMFRIRLYSANLVLPSLRLQVFEDV